MLNLDLILKSVGRIEGFYPGEEEMEIIFREVTLIAVENSLDKDARLEEGQQFIQEATAEINVRGNDDLT